MSQKQDWEVERILQKDIFNKKVYYLVKWKGYSIEEATWEPTSNLENCQKQIQIWEQSINIIQSKPKKRVNNQKKPRGRKNKKKGGQSEQDEFNMIPLLSQKTSLQRSDYLLRKIQSIEKQTSGGQGFKFELISNEKESKALDHEIQVPYIDNQRQKLTESETHGKILNNVPKKEKSMQLAEESFLDIVVAESFSQAKQKKVQSSKECVMQTQNEKIIVQQPQICIQSEKILKKEEMLIFEQTNKSVSMFSQVKKKEEEESNTFQEVNIPKFVLNHPSEIISLLLNPRQLFCNQQHELFLREKIKIILSKEQTKTFNLPFLDLRDYPDTLEELGPIDIHQNPSVKMQVKLLVKIQGWMAVGMTENHLTIANIESLSEDSWISIVQKVSK